MILLKFEESLPLLEDIINSLADHTGLNVICEEIEKISNPTMKVNQGAIQSIKIGKGPFIRYKVIVLDKEIYFTFDLENKRILIRNRYSKMGMVPYFEGALFLCLFQLGGVPEFSQLNLSATIYLPYVFAKDKEDFFLG